MNVMQLTHPDPTHDGEGRWEVGGESQIAHGFHDLRLDVHYEDGFLIWDKGHLRHFSYKKSKNSERAQMHTDTLKV